MLTLGALGLIFGYSSGEHEPVYRVAARLLRGADGWVLGGWLAVAMGVKLLGVMASALAWWLVLRGQRLQFPFVSQVFTAFLIGRFIGTFLPSTLGLDGYTVYEAGRYSGQWARAVAAKSVEKLLGVCGLLLCIVATLPAGHPVLVRVMGPLAAPWTAGFAVVGLGVPLLVIVGLGFSARWVPVLMRGIHLLPQAVRGRVRSFAEAYLSYRGQVGLLVGAMGLKALSHLTTAVVYYLTALAIGVVSPDFLRIVFGSLLQIVGTLLSPTMGGEGAREALQAWLLSAEYGGSAAAVLAASLGFIAAEAATLWGGVFWWTRTPSWRPGVVRVDGVVVAPPGG